MTLSEFYIFGEATEAEIDVSSAQLSNLSLWDAFFTIKKKYPLLASAVEFSTGDYWALKNPGAGIRHTIALIRDLRGELDPSKPEHLAIFGDLLCLFMFGVAQIGNQLFRAYLKPASRSDLDAVLLPYLYGGKESYQVIDKLSQSLLERNNVDGRKSIVFPELDLFAKLLRSILDAPVQALHTPLLAKEIAWTFLSENPKFSYATFLAAINRQIGKFCIQGAQYLVAAAKLPSEFSDVYRKLLLSIQTTPEELTHFQGNSPIK